MPHDPVRLQGRNDPFPAPEQIGIAEKTVDLVIHPH